MRHQCTEIEWFPNPELGQDDPMRCQERMHSEKNMFTKSKHRFSHHVQNIFVRKRFFEIKGWLSKKLLCDLMNFVE